MLFADTFTNYNHPEIGLAAADVLEAAGMTVTLAPHVCCGRPLNLAGVCWTRRGRWRRGTSMRCTPQPPPASPIVFLEPSCLSAVKEDGPALLRGDQAQKARVVADACLLFEDHLERECAAGRSRADARRRTGERPAAAGHCHQKAMGMLPATRALLGRIPSGTVTDLDAGCCGMAGSFGYAKEHYEVSRQIGERKLLPAARAMTPGTTLVAPGTSCREQVKHFTGVTALHPAELLRSLLRP